jgi:hypothetical protein
VMNMTDIVVGVFRILESADESILPSRPKSAAADIAYLPNVVKATVAEAGVGVGGFGGSGEHGGVTLPDRQGVFSRRSAM